MFFNIEVRGPVLTLVDIHIQVVYIFNDTNISKKNNEWNITLLYSILSNILCFCRNTKLHFPFSPQLQAENSIFHVNDSDFRITLGIKYENFSTSTSTSWPWLSVCCATHSSFVLQGSALVQLASRLLYCEEVGFFVLHVILFGPRPSSDTQQRL